MLIVDDSLSMRHVLSVAVKKAGWTPVPARDGLEALDLIQRAAAPPDLVLLDIEMPRMDGFEFLSTIRSQKGRADLPIVMLTSRSGDKHRDKAQALGATDYMVKPFQEDTLIRNIDRLVQGLAAGRTDGRRRDPRRHRRRLAVHLQPARVVPRGRRRLQGGRRRARRAIDARADPREAPDVLTLDLQMPGGDGLELLRAARAASRRSRSS